MEGRDGVEGCLKINRKRKSNWRWNHLLQDWQRTGPQHLSRREESIRKLVQASELASFSSVDDVDAQLYAGRMQREYRISCGSRSLQG